MYRSLCGPRDEGDEGLYALMITENTIVIGGGVKTTGTSLCLHPSAYVRACSSKPSPIRKKFNVTAVEVFCVCSDLP